MTAHVLRAVPSSACPGRIAPACLLILAQCASPDRARAQEGIGGAAGCAVTLPDALAKMPGLDVVQTGSPGGQTSVFVRGTNSNHVKVLIDGIDASDPSNPNGSFDFGQFLTADVARIEVLRGPQSGNFGQRLKGDYQGQVELLRGETLVAGAEREQDRLAYLPSPDAATTARNGDTAGTLQLASNLGNRAFLASNVRCDRNDSFGSTRPIGWRRRSRCRGAGPSWRALTAPASRRRP